MLDVKNLEVENLSVPRRRHAEPDAIDEKLVRWTREIPELDVETEGIVDRICYLERTIRRSHEETLEEFAITWGEWRVLGALRHAGPPYHGSPGHLAEQLGLSSGAMTARLDKLEGAGLVRRLRDPLDRRGVVVELTDAGRELWQKSTGVQAEKEALIASALGMGEKQELNELLRRLVHAFTDHVGPPPKKREHD